MSSASVMPSAGEGASKPDTKLTQEEFERVTALVMALAGIVIKEHKREMLVARLSRRLRALNFSNVSAYLDFVESPKGEGEIGELINAVTTNLTSFFREGHHFEHFQKEMLEPMAAAGQPRVRVWSSACSTGEEPYSIAMTAQSANGYNRFSDFKLLATDLDTNVLAKASSGVYATDRVKTIPTDKLGRFFRKHGDGEHVVKDEVKSIISFRQLNLLHQWPVKGPFDVIFCRNVLIYFDAPTKRDIVDRLVRLVRPEGTLYLGHSESLLGDHPLLVSEGKTIYRRRPE
ncbi:MAG: protein-glutamate O-methyltransferase CheR [Rhodobacteraceae bacterium]|nr:protein-glutamate O-methyltransferase CheR [Paracoccaceae bacterium]